MKLTVNKAMILRDLWPSPWCDRSTRHALQRVQSHPAECLCHTWSEWIPQSDQSSPSLHHDLNTSVFACQNPTKNRTHISEKFEFCMKLKPKTNINKNGLQNTEYHLLLLHHLQKCNSWNKTTNACKTYTAEKINWLMSHTCTTHTHTPKLL